MVKFYESSHSYDYSFSAVCLAYFLRYPNPYSKHVVSSDVIERTFDPEKQQVTTVRLHLKKSRVPSAVLAILPRSFVGADENGQSCTHILETSTVDIRDGWMRTESRNVEWTGVLSVVERQLYRRPYDAHPITFMGCENAAAAHGIIGPRSKEADLRQSEKTDVTTTVILKSRLGQRLRKRQERRDAESAAAAAAEPEEKLGFFSRWSTGSIQRSIELIGYKRAQRSQPNATEGMKVVLERIRQGGLVAVLEGMRRDREVAYGTQEGGWKFRKLDAEDRGNDVD